MSFALEVKEELSRLNIEAYGERYAVLEAILKNAFEVNLLGLGRVKLIYASRSNTLTRFVIKLVTSFHHVDYELYQRQIMRFDKPMLFYVEIANGAELFVEEFSLLTDNPGRKKEILESQLEKSAYLRGTFIAKGSVNDPETSNYHLEFNLNNDAEAIFIQTILNSYNYNARITKRRDNYVVYVKEIEAICDILRIMGAKETVFTLENKMITRGLKSQTKRQINFDIANQSKTNEAAKNELRYIRYLEYYYPLEKLDPKLLMLMKVRKENPEASLNELCQILLDVYGEKVTKSGLNHRFRKLKEIALDYQKRRQE